ncbi:hypothetical protein FF38_01233, partial [Lucilia cuprina]
MNNNNCTETPLSSTKSGTEILKYYDKHQILQEEHRTLLINTITQYLDLNGCEVSLSDCAELEKQICNRRADDFDLYWRKCAPLRFKQIAEAKTTTEILNLWPEYTQPSAFQFINIDFILKYPSAKCLKDRWTQLEDSILNILKSKSGCSILLKDLQKVGSNNEESKTFTIFWHAHKLFPPQHT